MEPSKGPVLPEPLVDPSHLTRLDRDVDVDKELGYLFEAIRLTRLGLDGRVPLIGFCGAPWTLMAYMVEGGGSRNYEKAKGWLYKYPKESKELLARVADVCADMLVGQVLGGAQVSGPVCFCLYHCPLPSTTPTTLSRLPPLLEPPPRALRGQC